MVNPNLLRSILFGIWCVDETTQIAALPLIGKLIQGEAAEFYDVPKSEFKPYAVSVAKNDYWDGFAKAAENSVSVLPVKGMITKEDQYCGPSGTLTLMRNLQAADNTENIIAHVLDINSGGGEATNIQSVASFIRNNIKKPVFAWYNGLNASAAYGIAVGADEIFAAQSTDIVGSIGVMTTIANWKKYYAQQGLELSDVYSNLSSEKNGIWQEALDGNLEPLKEKLLDPFAKSFHASVNSMRPNLDKKVLKGATYMTTEAKQLGLIDGQKSWAKMLEYAEAKGLKYKKSISKNNQNTTSMKFDKVAAFFGFKAIEQDSEGNASFNAEQLAKMEAHLEATEGLEAKLTAKFDEKLVTVDAKITAMEKTLNEKINAFELQQTEIKKTVDAVSDLAPATKPVEGEEETEAGDEQFMTAAEKKLQAEFEQ